MEAKAKIRVAHLSGPNATIQNTPPLVTSNKARHEIRPAADARAGRQRREIRRACARSAWPRRPRSMSSSSRRIRSERDAAELYGAARRLYRCRRRLPQGAPQRARQAGLRDRAAARGRALSAALHGAPGGRAGLGRGMRRSRRAGRAGAPGLLPRRLAQLRGDRPPVGRHRTAWRIRSRRRPRSISIACCRRAASPRACRRHLRTDVGEGDIAPETRGKDFFPYKPLSPRRRRRRGRRSRASPTSRSTSCRAANTTARS